MSISDERCEDSPDMVTRTRELPVFEYNRLFAYVYFQGYC